MNGYIKVYKKSLFKSTYVDKFCVLQGITLALGDSPDDRKPQVLNLRKCTSVTDVGDQSLDRDPGEFELIIDQKKHIFRVNPSEKRLWLMFLKPLEMSGSDEPLRIVPVFKQAIGRVIEHLTAHAGNTPGLLRHPPNETLLSSLYVMILGGRSPLTMQSQVDMHTLLALLIRMLKLLPESIFSDKLFGSFMELSGEDEETINNVSNIMAIRNGQLANQDKLAEDVRKKELSEKFRNLISRLPSDYASILIALARMFSVLLASSPVTGVTASLIGTAFAPAFTPRYDPSAEADGNSGSRKKNEKGNKSSGSKNSSMSQNSSMSLSSTSTGSSQDFSISVAEITTLITRLVSVSADLADISLSSSLSTASFSTAALSAGSISNGAPNSTGTGTGTGMGAGVSMLATPMKSVSQLSLPSSHSSSSHSGNNDRHNTNNSTLFSTGLSFSSLSQSSSALPPALAHPPSPLPAALTRPPSPAPVALAHPHQSVATTQRPDAAHRSMDATHASTVSLTLTNVTMTPRKEDHAQGNTGAMTGNSGNYVQKVGNPGFPDYSVASTLTDSQIDFSQSVASPRKPVLGNIGNSGPASIGANQPIPIMATPYIPGKTNPALPNGISHPVNYSGSRNSTVPNLGTNTDISLSLSGSSQSYLVLSPAVTITSDNRVGVHHTQVQTTTHAPPAVPQRLGTHARSSPRAQPTAAPLVPGALRTPADTAHGSYYSHTSGNNDTDDHGNGDSVPATISSPAPSTMGSTGRTGDASAQTVHSTRGSTSGPASVVSSTITLTGNNVQSLNFSGSDTNSGKLADTVGTISLSSDESDNDGFGGTSRRQRARRARGMTPTRLQEKMSLIRDQSQDLGNNGQGQTQIPENMSSRRNDIPDESYLSVTFADSAVMGADNDDHDATQRVDHTTRRPDTAAQRPSPTTERLPVATHYIVGREEDDDVSVSMGVAVDGHVVPAPGDTTDLSVSLEMSTADDKGQQLLRPRMAVGPSHVGPTSTQTPVSGMLSTSGNHLAPPGTIPNASIPNETENSRSVRNPSAGIPPQIPNSASHTLLDLSHAGNISIIQPIPGYIPGQSDNINGIVLGDKQSGMVYGGMARGLGGMGSGAGMGTGLGVGEDTLDLSVTMADNTATPMAIANTTAPMFYSPPRKIVAIGKNPQNSQFPPQQNGNVPGFISPFPPSSSSSSSFSSSDTTQSASITASITANTTASHSNSQLQPPPPNTTTAASSSRAPVESPADLTLSFAMSDARAAHTPTAGAGAGAGAYVGTRDGSAAPYAAGGSAVAHPGHATRGGVTTQASGVHANVHVNGTGIGIGRGEAPRARVVRRTRTVQAYRRKIIPTNVSSLSAMNDITHKGGADEESDWDADEDEDTGNKENFGKNQNSRQNDPESAVEMFEMEESFYEVDGEVVGKDHPWVAAAKVGGEGVAGGGTYIDNGTATSTIGQDTTTIGTNVTTIATNDDTGSFWDSFDPSIQASPTHPSSAHTHTQNQTHPQPLPLLQQQQQPQWALQGALGKFALPPSRTDVAALMQQAAAPLAVGAGVGAGAGAWMGGLQVLPSASPAASALPGMQPLPSLQLHHPHTGMGVGMGAGPAPGVSSGMGTGTGTGTGTGVGGDSDDTFDLSMASPVHSVQATTGNIRPSENVHGFPNNVFSGGKLPMLAQNPFLSSPPSTTPGLLTAAAAPTTANTAATTAATTASPSPAMAPIAGNTATAAGVVSNGHYSADGRYAASVASDDTFDFSTTSTAPSTFPNPESRNSAFTNQNSGKPLSLSDRLALMKRGQLPQQHATAPATAPTTAAPATSPFAPTPTITPSLPAPLADTHLPLPTSAHTPASLATTSGSVGAGGVVAPAPLVAGTDDIDWDDDGDTPTDSGSGGASASVGHGTSATTASTGRDMTASLTTGVGMGAGTSFPPLVSLPLAFATTTTATTLPPRQQPHTHPSANGTGSGVGGSGGGSGNAASDAVVLELMQQVSMLKSQFHAQQERNAALSQRCVALQSECVAAYQRLAQAEAQKDMFQQSASTTVQELVAKMKAFEEEQQQRLAGVLRDHSDTVHAMQEQLRDHERRYIDLRLSVEEEKRLTQELAHARDRESSKLKVVDQQYKLAKEQNKMLLALVSQQKGKFDACVGRLRAQLEQEMVRRAEVEVALETAQERLESLQGGTAAAGDEEEEKEGDSMVAHAALSKKQLRNILQQKEEEWEKERQYWEKRVRELTLNVANSDSECQSLRSAHERMQLQVDHLKQKNTYLCHALQIQQRQQHELLLSAATHPSAARHSGAVGLGAGIGMGARVGKNLDLTGYHRDDSNSPAHGIRRAVRDGRSRTRTTATVARASSRNTPVPEAAGADAWAHNGIRVLPLDMSLEDMAIHGNVSRSASVASSPRRPYTATGAQGTLGSGDGRDGSLRSPSLPTNARGALGAFEGSDGGNGGRGSVGKEDYRDMDASMSVLDVSLASCSSAHAHATTIAHNAAELLSQSIARQLQLQEHLRRSAVVRSAGDIIGDGQSEGGAEELRAARAMLDALQEKIKRNMSV